jgi:hypothetical protein
MRVVPLRPDAPAREIILEIVSVMLCERGKRGAWGRLDPAAVPVRWPWRDPRFPGHLRALSPTDDQRLLSPGSFDAREPAALVPCVVVNSAA